MWNADRIKAIISFKFELVSNQIAEALLKDRNTGTHLLAELSERRHS